MMRLGLSRQSLAPKPLRTPGTSLIKAARGLSICGVLASKLGLTLEAVGIESATHCN